MSISRFIGMGGRRIACTKGARRKHYLIAITQVLKSEDHMKLQTYWKVWVHRIDGIWRQAENKLDGVASDFLFVDLKSAETQARLLTEGKDVVEVEVREERSILHFAGAAHESAER